MGLDAASGIGGAHLIQQALYLCPVAWSGGLCSRCRELSCRKGWGKV